MLRLTDRGLYCEAADLYIDPWLAVDRAVITHAHGAVERFTPLSFPLLVDRTRNKVSSEKLADRIARMQLALERAAG